MKRLTHRIPYTPYRQHSILPPTIEPFMGTIAVTSTDPALTGPLCQAFPDAQLLHLTLKRVEDTAAQQLLSFLVVDHKVLADEGPAPLAMLKARFPALPIIALLAPDPSVSQILLNLVGARVDVALISGTEDHPDRLQLVFTEAAANSVAYALESACQPVPPALVTANLVPALAAIRTLKHAGALADALGQGLGSLRQELRKAHLFPPKMLLASLRTLAASRRLGDSTQSVEQIATQTGYGSAVSLHHAYQRLLNSTPQEVRSGGGLWFASQRFGHFVYAWRAKFQ